jgi:hypothetical protein
LGGPSRVACVDCADSMLQFRLEIGGNGTKRYRMMKWRQRARLNSMGRKHDPVWWHDDID